MERLEDALILKTLNCDDPAFCDVTVARLEQLTGLSTAALTESLERLVLDGAVSTYFDSEGTTWVTRPA
jgi:hypothetical protein